MPSDCPMHAKQPRAPGPHNQNDCADLPCCKNVQTAALVHVRLLARPFWFAALITFFSPAPPEFCASPAQSLMLVDTGPPGENSFAELVLQRSILAHAPPGSLS